MNLTNGITAYEIKKIFSKREEKEYYIRRIYIEKNINRYLPTTNASIDLEIINTWDYEISKKIIREMFENTEKYRIGKYSDEALQEMLRDWNRLELGEIKWPFNAMAFDQYVQGINCKDVSEEEKDQIVQNDIIRFRRIKRINTVRNDFIEYLIVDNNDNVIPTLKHNRGLDFYINGCPYDQKVSKSVTNEFKTAYGDEWKNIAIEHPEIVAKYLYKYQDEQRFGSESRLLIVYLDEDVETDKIAQCVRRVSLRNPIGINFDYQHSSGEIVNYSTECYVIMIHN